ncbi:MAG: hypothetical protein FWC58_11480 [Desulfobulbus sp.]|nr:hypothetical protein [Desulfobulbus sp.]
MPELMTEITLMRPHRHGGRDYPPGARLTLHDDQAQWLIGKGVAEPAAPDAAAPDTASAKKGAK